MVKKAVLIGINYKGQEGALSGCINDINNIKDILINNCDYNPNNVKILSEETSILPNRKNIEENINWLVSNLLPNDVLYLHYSGHGSYIKDTSGDETDGKDEVIIPLDYQSKGVITDDWLFTNLVSKIPQNVTLWAFMDCCHSGTMIDLKYNYKSMCQYKNGKVNSKTVYNPTEWNDKFAFSIEKTKDVVGNIYLFSGCLDSQTSADAHIENKYQGAFTYCFVQLLKGNMSKTTDGKTRFKNGTIKLRNVLKEINGRLDINNFTQDSQLSISKQSDLERTLDL